MICRRPAIMAVLAVALAGCGTLPTSGPVESGVEAAPDQGVRYVVGDAPTPGDTPAQIVRGFQSASVVGSTDDFRLARDFLTSATAGSWASTEHVIVYDASVPLDYRQPSEGVVEVTATVEATVDAVGVYTQATPGSTTTLRYELIQELGEWRIVEIPAGTLISEVSFPTVYRQVALHFITADRTALVPDPRWFPQRNTPTYAMRALLAGAAAWLRPAVVSAMPGGTALSVDSVTVSGGEATVPLTSEVQSASPQDRALLLTQVEETLTDLPSVQEVVVTVSGVRLEESNSTPALTVAETVSGPPQMLADDQMATLTGTQVVPVPEAGSLAGLLPDDPAIAYDDGPTVLLSGEQRLITAPTSATPAIPLYTGTDLLSPTYAPNGWVWTGERANQGELVTVLPTAPGTVGVVKASALNGVDVREIRVSRDGARLSVVIDDGPATRVLVFSVVMSPGGVPAELGKSITLARGLADVQDLVWVDSSTLAVLGKRAGTQSVSLVPIGGPITPLPTVAETRDVAAGNGARELYLSTADGRLFGRSGNGWAELASGVFDPAFPG